MRILFADDSMTAQNMGKKILTEAGYEVVAVSNGAAAVKKIAEQKPDIIILDIYMPGYTGLEVCDKVRASVDTLKTPVLLTVGKMEPYRAEDANRVKADGVIIKPFEASDLLAVVKKLEERVVPKTVAMADKTIRLDRLPDFDEVTPEPPQHRAEMQVEATPNGAPAMVDVPDNMATSAAFSDLLGPEPVHSFEPVPTPVMELPISPALTANPPAPVSFSPVEAAVSGNGVVEVPEFSALPPESIEEWNSPAPSAHDAELEITPAHTQAAPPISPAIEEPAVAVEAAPSWPDTQPIPIYQEIESQSIETFDAPLPAAAAGANTAPSGVAEPGNQVTDMALEEREQPNAVASSEPATPVVEAPSPQVASSGFSTEAVEFDSFSVKVDAQIREIESIVSAAEAHTAEPAVPPPSENGLDRSTVSAEVMPSGEDDFESRVAAAMSIYDESVEDETAAAPAAVEASYEQPLQPVSLHTGSPTFAPAEALLEAPYSFEYSPPITAPEPEAAAEAFAATPTPKQMAQTIPFKVEKSIVPATISRLPVETSSAVAPQPEPPAAIELPVPVATPELSVEAESAVVPEPEASVTVEEPRAIQAHSRVDDEKILSEIEAQLPAAAEAAAADPSLDTQVISSIVHRVLERLKPQLIEEISRELKNSNRG